MSLQLQKEIFTNGTLKIMVNVSGVGTDDTINIKNFKLEVYAFDKKFIFSEHLNIEDIRDLYNYLSQFSVITNTKTNTTEKFIEVTGDLIDIVKRIETVDTKFVKLILDKVDEEDKLKTILESLTNFEVENLQATIQQKTNKTAIAHLEELLQMEQDGNIVNAIQNINYLELYKAKQPEKIFQNWIENNLWVLGVEYSQKLSTRKIGLDTESDLMMETPDGFIDLIELKRPEYDLFKYDNSHNCYFPSTDLSKVIGQSLHYLHIMDVYKTTLENTKNIRIVRPRIKIIAGRSLTFKEEEFRTLRMLNSNLNHIEILTYDYLVSSGKKIIELYDE